MFMKKMFKDTLLIGKLTSGKARSDGLTGELKSATISFGLKTTGLG
jgi:hypothetical protein